MVVVSTRHTTNLINAHTYISGHVHKCNPGLNFADEVQSAKTTKFYTPRKLVPRKNSYPYNMTYIASVRMPSNVKFLSSVLRICLFRAADLACCLDVEIDHVPTSSSHSPEFIQEFSCFCLGKSLFDKREFRRAAHVLKNCRSNEGFFLKLYSLYLV